ncbi:hypothetical protein GCM10022215_18070 [Nocardioides fonticola]|uniref:Uncharacterized protein n=1 Tax=Nocardioides fonticola TaxID=450363 RepID=A0ABP7XJ79_9ACTN
MYQVITPLVIIPHADRSKGGDWYGYSGSVVPEGLNDERCAVLAAEGFLAVLDDPVVNTGADTGADQGAGVKPAKKATADEVLEEVGTDVEKAKAVLAAELASAKPRTGLVTKLEAIVGADGGGD